MVRPPSLPPPDCRTGAAPEDSPDVLGMPDESPTLLKRDSAVRAIRDMIDLIPKLTIDVKREAEHGPRQVSHRGEVCRIGTHSSNDLVLRDPAVSRFHCKLTRDGAIWRLQDNGSLNGTQLDGVRIRDAEFGGEGTISIGDSVLQVRAQESTDQVTLPNIQSYGCLIGASVAMRRLFAFLEKVAASEINVLIEGESGTGKELVAAEIAQRGPRADRPFVIVDCGAISPNLVESELFGHVRGAFTGADRDRVGAFETANGGTIFLDEIGELPLELQPKLLRALEAREIRRLGESRSRKVNVRVIAATNRDLEREVNKGRFREDLYFRLAVMNVHVPPLREHVEDLPLLIRGFLSGLGLPDQIELFPPRILVDLASHDWPGNVRELRNYVERTVVLREPPPTIHRKVSESPDVDLRVSFKVAKDAVVDAFERDYISALLTEAGGNISRASRNGGMDRMYLHRLVQKHGLRTAPRGSGDA
ncbi:MAG: sigma 54-interacting transcriptional regulator [Polyangiaceae bacterium]|jgi:transcriptional regulator with GAF, ATPase, and Fis domain